VGAGTRTYLVTGGVGFIGYHVSRALLDRGDRVVVLDDFSDAPYPRAMKERNRADLELRCPAIDVRTACVTDRGAVREAVTGADAVIHLAGLAGVRPSFADPCAYARVNVEGTANVMEAALEAGVRRVLFASSSSVYGDSTPLPAREEEPAIVPESPYAASKRAAELVAAAIARRAPDLACTGLRFFTVYGPRQRPEMAITLFARAILEGRAIAVFGDGSMRRDFTHVDDIVRGVLLALDRATPGYRVYNLGSRAPVTLTELVRALERASGRNAIVHHAPVPLGDVVATFADVTRARDELGWEPRISLADGLGTVVAWLTVGDQGTSPKNFAE
jgi:UDP-glucuronate 4-epimerase